MQFGHTNILRVSITLETLRNLRYPQTSKLNIEKLLLSFYSSLAQMKHRAHKTKEMGEGIRAT